MPFRVSATRLTTPWSYLYVMHAHAIATKRTWRDSLSVVPFAAWPQQPERWCIGTLMS
jgi:hypothetical protein